MLDPRHRVVPPHRVVFQAFALLVVSAVSYAAYMTPLNVNDSVKHLFLFETQSASHIAYREFVNAAGGADWRPLQFPIGQFTYTFFAQGHEHLVFKGLLVGCLFLTIGLFVRLVDIRNWTDALAAAIALLVLIGHHSFGGAVEAVYPYGIEIVLLVCQFAVLNIVLRKEPRLFGEIIAVAISIFAILFKEMGGFVGATYILAAILRLPGATPRAARIVFAAYVAILCYRFWVASPALHIARSAAHGYLQAILDTVAPILNILISDPRLGHFATIPQAMMGRPWAIVYLLSSVLLSALIVAWAWCTRKRFQDSHSQEHKVAAIFVMLLLGSAMFGPFARKDYLPIMALAGYAVVAFYALRWFFAKTLAVKRLAAYSVLLALGAGLSLSWSIRAAGLVYYLRQVAFTYQVEWMFGLDMLARTDEFSPSITQPIIARLRPEALSPPLNHPHLIFPRLITHFMRGRACPEICPSP
jgi:hypothetical protein